MCGFNWPGGNLLGLFDYGRAPVKPPEGLSARDQRRWDAIERQRVALIKKADAKNPFWWARKRLPPTWAHSGS
jgi:hypothetical protein